MKVSKRTICSFFLAVLVFHLPATAQKKDMVAEVKKAMMKASKFMVDEVAVNGGYVRVYLPDMTRRWGELEFYKTQVQVQSPGTVSMANLFLDAYETTGDEYYYKAAEKAAEVLIFGQLPCGGWNYMIDLAGDRSLKQWYNTIGKNAWGFEEFYHYYGNATFDDVNTSDVGKFLLRIYLEKLDARFKPALDKVIALLLEAQYPNGGWPQRYPLMYDFPHGKGTDYTSFVTFNDEATWGNIELLIQCYAMLGEQRLLEPIQRGMNLYLITQQGNPQAGWGQQYDLDLKPDHARSYEPAALCTGQTYDHILRCIHFYELTGDRRFITRIPDAIKWLEDTRLPADQTNGGKRSHPLFVELGTNEPIWAHRTGTGVDDQHYWIDKNIENLYAYGDNTVINIDYLKREYERVKAVSPEEISKNSPLKVTDFNEKKTPQRYYQDQLPWDGHADVARIKKSTKVPDETEIAAIIKSLDSQNRWLTKHEWISDPFKVLPSGKESNTAMRGDPIHGNWILDDSEQEYISVPVFQNNMQKLISFLRSRSN